MAAGREGRWTHGFDVDGWDNACREVREFLITVARRSEAKPFVSLAELATCVSVIPFSRAPGRKPGAILSGLLSDVDRVEVAAGRPMLSALVSDERRDPARRFALAARRLGRRGADDEVMWIAEVKAVRDFWANEAAGHASNEGLPKTAAIDSADVLVVTRTEIAKPVPDPKKVQLREARLSRAVTGRGYKLVKSKSRDRRRRIFGTYGIINPTYNTWVAWNGRSGYGMSLDDVEEWLAR